jgi:hypothetical protein
VEISLQVPRYIFGSSFAGFIKEDVENKSCDSFKSVGSEGGGSCRNTMAAWKLAMVQEQYTGME